VRHLTSRLTRALACVSLLSASLWVGAACSGAPPPAFAATDAGDGTDGSTAETPADGGAAATSSSGSSGGVSGSSGGGGSSSGSSSGVTASSGSGSSSGVGSSSGIGSSSGVGSGPGSGSSGGPSSGIPTTGVCAGNGTRVLTNSQPSAFVDDFEEAAISPAWSSFNDVSPVQNSFLITQVAGGADGTAHAGHYAGTGAITTAAGGFGVGTVYNTAIDPTAHVYCIDIAAFTGVSFWAKAATAGSTVALNFVLPQTNMATSNDAGVPTGGDCVSGCYNHPRITFTLTTAWAQYTGTFAAATGGSATVGSVIQELAWLSPDSAWDFTLDEIAFYAGTPPPGAVGPNPQ
jgi:hypothetical protein